MQGGPDGQLGELDKVVSKACITSVTVPYR